MNISVMTIRRFRLVACVAICMSAGSPLLASPFAERMFAGGSVNYIIPSADGMSKIENALGFKITAGYQMNNSLAFVFDYIIVPSMKNDEKAEVIEYSSRYYYYAYAVQPLTEASFRSFCISIRYLFNPLANYGGLRPYVAGGIGSMRIKAEKYADLPAEYADADWDNEYDGLDTLSDLFAKFATGLEYQFSDDISLSAELEYVMGQGDIDPYTHIAIGTRFAYHF